jgi:hypothetical protein
MCVLIKTRFNKNKKTNNVSAKQYVPCVRSKAAMYVYLYVYNLAGILRPNLINMPENDSNLHLKKIK